METRARDPAARPAIVRIFQQALTEFKEDGAMRLAAALSYYSMLSLVPLMLLVVAVAGFILSDPSVVDDLVARVVDTAGSEVGRTIEDLLVTVRDQRVGALSLGIVLAAFSASGIFQQVQNVLGVVFRIPEEHRRTGAVGWLVKRSIALVSALGLAIIVFTPIAAVGAIRTLASLLPDRLGWLAALLHFVVPIVSLAVLMAVVGLTFQLLTPVTIPWKAAVRGGAFTALVGLVAAFLIGEYLTRVGSQGTLGALGGFAILMLFMALMWTVYLFGAEVTKVYADYLEHGLVGDRARRPSRTSPEAGDVPARVLPAFLIGLAIGWWSRRRRR